MGIMQIASNRVATFDFKVTDSSGVLLDSSEESGAYPYLHGMGHLIPGLESQMEGRSPSDSFTVSVAPADGYGERDESMVQKIPRDKFTDIDQLHEGMMVEAHYENETRVMTVTSIDNDWITIDGNHPLAGMSLYFEVTVKDVREATPEEIEQGTALW
jgi:FKBP-type peptidyl-prolyl cis-trans isomerase SlyD